MADLKISGASKIKLGVWFLDRDADLSFQVSANETQQNQTIIIDWGDGSPPQEHAFTNSNQVRFERNYEDYLADNDYEVYVTIHGNITSLDCEQQGLVDIIFSDCETLQTVACGKQSWGSKHGELHALDFSRCPSLETLECEGSLVSKIKLNGCSKLKYLNLNDNELSELDLSGCPSLEQLFLSENPLEALDLSAQKRLYNVNLSDTELDDDELDQTIETLNDGKLFDEHGEELRKTINVTDTPYYDDLDKSNGEAKGWEFEE